MERWPKWPLAAGSVLWVVVAIAAYRGVWWPVWAALGIGALAALGGLGVLLFARQTSASFKTQLESSDSPKRAPSGAKPRNRGKKRRR